jgi:hypothetical protein
MREYKTFCLVMFLAAFVGFAGWLVASPSPTTRPAPADDVAGAQQAMQKLLEQGPPITSPSVPGARTGDKKGLSSPSKGEEKFLAAPASIVPPSKSQIKHKLFPEGHYIADRRGRLICSNDYWLFVFESDGKALADPPIKVLPNRWLEKMESDIAASREAMIFRISGEVTTYRGQNFILLRKVLIEREPGDNLR